MFTFSFFPHKNLKCWFLSKRGFRKSTQRLFTRCVFTSPATRTKVTVFFWLSVAISLTDDYYFCDDVNVALIFDFLKKKNLKFPIHILINYLDGCWEERYLINIRWFLTDRNGNFDHQKTRFALVSVIDVVFVW